jgi:hypothetical protein
MVVVYGEAFSNSHAIPTDGAAVSLRLQHAVVLLKRELRR